MLSILSILEDTTVDGSGFRTTVYCAGCPNACPDCHNPQTQGVHNEQWIQVEGIMRVIGADPFTNVTLSGDGPMFQAEGFAELAHAVRTCTNKTMWCYTGFIFEALIKNPQQRQLLEWIGVLVNDPSVERLKDSDLLFRGNSSRCIISVPLSLQQGKAVLWGQEDDMQIQ